MRGDHQRYPVILPGQNPAEMCVPGMAMNQTRVDVRRVEVDATPYRSKRGLQRLRTGKAAGIEFVAGDFEPAVLEVLVAETADFDVDCFRELASEIIDVHSGPAVNVRRVFVR